MAQDGEAVREGSRDRVRPGYAFTDPTALAALALESDGLTLLRGLRDGMYPAPPIASTIEFQILEVDRGRVVVLATPQFWQYNPIGSVHGGVISTLLDTAAGCAVHSTLPAGQGYTTLDLSVKFLRAVTVDTGPVTAIGTILTSGRRTALAEARLHDGTGRLLAHATSSCLLFAVPSDSPGHRAVPPAEVRNTGQPRSVRQAVGSDVSRGPTV
jgi:uncharacterized protein (TIGR00369 family)